MRMFVAICLATLLAAARAAAEPASPPDTGAYALPEIGVEGPRIPLEEIVRRARESEKSRARGTPGVSFSRFRKIVMTHLGDGGRAERRDVIEEVHRVRVLAPEKVEVVTLRRREYRADGDSAAVRKEKIDPGIDFDEFSTNILGLTLSLENVGAFDYTLLDRNLFGDYLVYHIGFEPKSSFEPLPSGEVWIETGDFVVLHENAWLRDVVPLPFVIRSIDRVSRERERIEGRWVWTRQQVAVSTRLGAVGGPDLVELCDTHGDYRFPEAEAGGERLVGGRRGAAEMEAFRAAIAASSAAHFTAFASPADLALADSLRGELDRAGYEALRKERGGPRADTRLEPLPGAWGLNRVDGARAGAGALVRRGAAAIGGWAAHATSADRWMGEARLDVTRARPGRPAAALAFVLSDRTRTMLTNDPPGAGWTALAGLDDPLDHYRRREAAIALSVPAATGLRLSLGYAAGEDRPLARALRRHPLRGDDYRPNPRARAGDRTVLEAEATGERPGLSFRLAAEVAAPEIGPGDFRYGRLEGALAWEPAPLGPAQPRFAARAGLGPGAPLQRRFSLGGASTVHGMAPNEDVGASLLFARVEAAAARRVLPEIDLPLVGTLRLQPAAFLEWGAAPAGSVPALGAGIALDQYVGLFTLEALRATAAWRLPDGAPRFGVEFRSRALR